MRSFWTYCLTIVVLLAANCDPTIAHKNLVLPREETASKSAASTSASLPSSATSKAAASITESSSAASSQSESASPQASESGNGTASATSTDDASPGVILGPTPTPFNGSINGSITNLPHIEGLPIHPEVTPALAVAGALLILTGAIYTIIGIKTKWLHIFCSTAYLFALCVTILIIYVMHPPVSNGVQGAYFVAAAVTGIIFGAIAVVFADVTEGLGCFLGGFCLGMWFLVLKPGGLITSTAGKAIFIASFTVGTFALYISHYTRPYGLIGSTSFAGATAVLLGVDMFSRAGLKEFWLYIWDLNDGLFPLHYEGPYPMTRGVRVEIAGIVLLSILGVMSQMKVWNIVKKRREEKAAEERRKALERDQAEEELGRKLEDDNSRDRQMWDAVYGKKERSNRSQVDSGIGTDEPSTRKGSMSVVDVRDLPEGLEMQNLASSKSSQKGGRVVVVHVGQDDEIVAVRSPSDTKSMGTGAGSVREPSIREIKAAVAKSITSDSSSIKTSQSTKAAPKKLKVPVIDPNLSLKPRVVSPPFKIPDDAASQYSDDKSSVATFAASDHVPERSTKRLSGSAVVRKLSGKGKRRSMGRTTSEEALVLPYVEEDRASSVAATLDGISIHNISQEKLSTGSRSPALSSVKSSEGFAMPQQTHHEEYDLSSWGILGQGANGASHEEATKSGKTEARLPAQDLSAAATNEHKTAARASFAGNLPDRTSKVVMAYRTNEWAKHLDSAEAPVLEEEKPAKPQAEPEITAPVNVQSLQQTALNAEPAPITSTKSESVEEEEERPSMEKTSSNPYFKQKSPRISPSASATNVAKTVTKSTSRTSLNSNDSNPDTSRPAPTRPRQSPTPRGLRSSSSPMVSSPLAETPIEEDVEASFENNRFTPSPMHLMSQRDQIIQQKPSSTSLLNPQASRSGLKRNSSASSSSAALVTNEADNIPLSHRKSLLQQQHHNGSQTLLPPQRSLSGSSTPVYTPMTSSPILSRNPSRLSLAHVNPPSPNPQRDSTLSAWRSSLASDAAHQNASQNAELEQRRLELLAEKQRTINSKQVAQMQEQQRKSQLDKEMMRRGSAMMDAHRDAMRKMQGQVNQGLANRPS